MLDWELARVSDPLFDVGYVSIPYVGGKLIDQPSTLLDGVAEPEWFYQEYEQRTGYTIEEYALDYWTALAIFSMITILQTGLSRFEAGESDVMDHAWIQYPLPGLFEDLVEILRKHVNERS